MYPITNEVMALFEAEHRKVLRITGTDKNGTAITITDDNVIADSFQIDRYSCNGEKLEIGTAIAAQLTLILENGDGNYDGIVFEGAELFVEVGIADWTQANPTVHWVPCGYFTPDEQPRRLSTIRITALDRMTRFDSEPLSLVPWTTANGEVMTTRSGEPIYFLKSIRFPCTIAEMVQQMATLCNIPFTQDLSAFPNYNALIPELPVTLDGITYRMILQWCAGIMGCNAWIDWNGALRFSWYTNATNYTSTIDNRYASDLYEDDLTITGVAYTNSSGVVFIEGTADYAVDVVGNYLIGGQVVTMLPAIANAVKGFTYRPFTASVVNAPYLWPMDIITFTDKDGNNHTGALTNVAFGLNGTTALESKGMTYAVNRGEQPSGFTKQQAQLVNEVRQSVENLDNSLTQEEIFNRLTDNGAAQALILYDGKLYLNASYIRAGTVSADILKGGALTLGGENNASGVLRVLDGYGNVIGTWTKDGIVANQGSIGDWQITSGGLQLSGDLGSVRVLASMGVGGVMFRWLGSGYRRTVFIDDRITLYDDTADTAVRLSVESDSDGNAVVLKLQTSLDGGATWADALSAGETATVLAQPLGLASGGTGVSAADNAALLDNLGAYSKNGVLTPSSSLAIPSPGLPLYGYLPGLTDKHELVRWNFSSSPENAPPANLTWATYNDRFTITNNGGVTDESIRPVFMLPNEGT